MANKRAISVDAQITQVAARQYGLMTTSQVSGAGLGRSAITQRLQARRLHRIHRGVYAVGHKALTHRARWLAAVLACGPGAALSHTDAAALWLLLPPDDHPGPIHVTVPGPG